MERMAFRLSTLVADVAIAVTAFICAYLLSPSRLPDLGFDGQASLNIVQLTLLYGLLAGVFTSAFRRELSPWRYASVPDALVLARIAVMTAGVFLLTVWAVDRARTLPRATLAMAPVFQMMGSMGLRLLRRAIHEHAFSGFSRFKPGQGQTHSLPILLVGPPSLADTYLRDISRNNDQSYNPVGIIGTDPRDVGQQVRGVCILESLANLDAALADLRRWNRLPSAILFLQEPGRLKGVSADQLGRMKTEGIRLLRMPSIMELGPDGRGLAPMRDISVEELLAREPIELDRAAIGALIRGRRVLITGAGGSIGSELCRQVARFECGHITLLDYSETALFEIDRELGESFPRLSRRAVLCDVRNAGRLADAFMSERPDLVFHAAALKHVSMVERHPCEGVLTNVIGTWNVAETARVCGAAQMVLISTDKAVDPSNVMGATKRLAEAVIAAQQTSDGTRFAAVRFGNVLGSAGSVVPIFRSQIERGGPVTVTHPEMRRFFMTIPEAAQLVLHATAASAEGEATHSRLFLLEMGEPVRIMDLAKQMIALSGRVLGKDIEIEVTGLRPGEKLSEALLDETEHSIPCAPEVMEVISSSALAITPAHLHELEALAEKGDTTQIRRALFDIVGQIRGEAPGAAGPLRVISQRN